jgi:prepilin-type N-terminal cleavage/methylation domain-containing protein
MRCGFTLVELLVVIATISLLLALSVPSLRKSLRQARNTVCQSNLREIYVSLDMYRTDNGGWIPTLPEDRKDDDNSAWWLQLVEPNPGIRGVMVCPDDPWASILRNQIATQKFGAQGPGSYGLNDFIASSPNSFLANLERYTPKRPGDTILVADLGPDIMRPNGVAVVPPTRSSGKLPIDDLYRPGDPPSAQPKSWLTERHMGFINFLTIVGNVKRVATHDAMRRPLASYYEYCAAGDCTICLYVDLPHYSFAEEQAYWWTGTNPRP